MEQALSLLRNQEGAIREWSDHQILAGHSIPDEITTNIKKADIIVFLVSPDFIASDACREEWSLARELCTSDPNKICIPIIIRPCPWQELQEMGNIKALPNDAMPVTQFDDPDVAWLQVYSGIKTVVDRLRMKFTVRPSFQKEMEQTDFLSQEDVQLQEIFVFPSLASFTPKSSDGDLEEKIKTIDDILKNKFVMIHGDQLSGKTAICRHIVLEQIERSKPVLYVDLKEIGRRSGMEVFAEAYGREFQGDFSFWSRQDGKVIVLDNLSKTRESVDCILLATEHFEHVIVTVSTDLFYAYYRDDKRFASFTETKILPFSHGQQERLIRNRLAFIDPNKAAFDGRVDEIERRVNSIIVNNRILPRFPFYILSILQTYEGFMPSNMSVTSYGHCYYILIIAHLLKSGVSSSDDEINACFNFSEHLAFEIYQHGSADCYVGSELRGEFVEKYRKKFILNLSTLHRLFDSDYGIVLSSGNFKYSYMYFYFLGKHLANNSQKLSGVIDDLVAKSHTPSNCLTLISLIHHTNDDNVIDEIVLRTMCTLDELAPATLDRDESEILDAVVERIPSDVLSVESVKTERDRQRLARDQQEDVSSSEWQDDEGEVDGDESKKLANDVYRIMKHNEILGRVLRNKYGSLRQDRVAEIIETVADGGLRLVRLLLNQEMVNGMAQFVHRADPEWDLGKIRDAIKLLTFVWTMHNVDRIVAALNKPEIRELVEQVVIDRDTPAYDLIGYFLELDTIDEFTETQRNNLRKLLRKRRYPFFERVVSLRTQGYLNTHNVRAPVQQSVCSTLGLTYRPRLIEPGELG